MMRTLVVAFLACGACGPSGSSSPESCTDGIANGDETDVDCGGPCQPCADGASCAVGTDCTSKVCNSTCSAPSCTDGVLNGFELGVDCGNTCPPIFTGIGCTMGTNGSQVCTSYTSGPTFTVTITWNAAGGNAYVDYVTAYGTQGEDYNSLGIVGGNAVNVCISGQTTATFQLPLGDGYTYKIWHAYCVRTDACDGCGNDTTTSEGGPFGVVQTC